MYECNCGAEYKTEKGLLKHINKCEFVDMDLNKVYRLGKIIQNESDLFHVHFGKLKKYMKENNLSMDEAREILLKHNIYSFRKSIWNILEVWKDELIPSEYRIYTKWIFKTYNDISKMSLRNVLSNTKSIYRYNMEHTKDMIEKRINESLLYTHKNPEFVNDFDFVDAIMTGDISMYYILFNDWLAEKWFGRLDNDLQCEMASFIEIASGIIVERVSHQEFDELNTLAMSDTPIIHAF